MRNEALRAARRPILVIENDHDVRKSLHLLLETRGYDVESVSNTREAFDKLRDGIDPCLILFDLGMLYEGWKHGRGQLERGFGRVPVIAYTADAQLRKDLKARLRSRNPAATLIRVCELAARHCPPSAEASGPPVRAARRESRRVDPSAGRGLKAPRSKAKGARHDVAARRRRNQPA
jgi:CheY-like chemotaxis protein